MISRRALIAGMMAAALPAWAEAPATSPRPPRRGQKPGVVIKGPAALIAAAKLGGVACYVVADALTGAVLESGDADTAVPPASVAKAITAQFALDRLGAAHRFRTKLMATGPVAAGVVQGDLVLVGAGDPTLSSDHLGDLAAVLAARGITGITGRYLACDGALPAIDRIDADQPEYVGYNPAISGLNLNFNRVNFEWKKAGKGYALQMDARGERFMPLVSMARMGIADREGPLFDYTPGVAEDSWTVARAALGASGSRWLPVRHPGVYTAEVFATLISAHGVKLPPADILARPPAGDVLAEHVSDDLGTILRDMLKFSTNVTAEVVGLHASGAGTLGGSGAAMTEWAQARLGMTSRFADHSGLGDASRVTAADMVRGLIAAQKTGAGLAGILRDVGMRDDQGKVIEGHPVQVMAKSGTLNFVSGLAGYITPPGGRALVFAVFCADTARRDALVMADRERPEGGEAWTKRARKLQGQLINRWAGLYA